jgi:hypothetical protein
MRPDRAIALNIVLTRMERQAWAVTNLKGLVYNKPRRAKFRIRSATPNVHGSH